ncbi:hypothetical protein CVIRNUC_005433 [Coccomyxa viridis]|uniref:BSD domain-containing protein n=1 Tax=Coccomyxa viridis TaxID=1274662 RepID=A0AAV1I867_9CHLO|nr:hypothetical protein CVIRNUC_005433 [Coccomyxa viridis]
MSASTPLLVKRAIFTLARDRKLPGVLTVNGSQIQWAAHDPTESQPHYIEIKAVSDSLQRAKGKPLLRIPTKDRPSVFEFESEADRDQAVDIITPLVKSAQEKGKGLANGAASGAKAAQGPHAELKKAVLAADRDLQALHEQLVTGGIISEAEFWRHRQHLLRQHAQEGPHGRQKQGPSNAMIEQSMDPNSNKVTLKLTPDVMQQIFQEKPHMKRAHNKLVPHTLSEKDFWGKFFNYEVARKAQGRSKKAGAEIEDPYQEFRNEHLDALEARNMLHNVNAEVNLAADLFDHGSQAREQEEEGSRQTISDINKHAAAVMRTAADSGSRGAGQQAAASAGAQQSGMASTALDDLRRPELAGFSQLRIQDPKRLHESAAPQQSHGAAEHGATAPSSLTDSDALEAVQMLLKDGAEQHSVSSQAAYAVLVELCRQSNTAASGLQALAHGPSGAEQNLVPRMQEILRQTVLACNELLRHFWAQFPLSTSKREARALDLKRALMNQYDRTTAMQEAAQGLDRVHITQLLKPLRQALDAAIIKHDNEAVYKSQPVST